MKKFALLAVCTLLPCLLWALRPGDRAEELKVRWLKGKEIDLFPKIKTTEKNNDKLVVVTFILTRAVNTAEAVKVLSLLQSEYQNKVRFGLVTPDEMADGEAFLQKFPDINFSFGLDEKRTLTPKYMNGSLLYPMSFVINNEGTILWCGELIDAGDFIKEFYSGASDLAREKKVAPMLDELQTTLQEANDKRMETLVKRILAADPGNAPALRMRTFILMQNNRPNEAYDLIKSQIAQTPSTPRLYFYLLNVTASSPNLTKNLAADMDLYLKSVKPDPAADNFLANSLLTTFGNNIDALIVAKHALARIDENTIANPLTAGTVSGTKALFYYKVGAVDQAIKYQQQALDFYQKAQTPDAVKQAKDMLDFYQKVKDYEKF